MIRRLVELAAAEGLSAEPTLSEVDGVFVDLRRPVRTEPRKGMVVRLRQRSGALAHQVPGWMTEKAANLAAGNPYRESQRKLAEAWSRRTDHPLPRALLDFLSSGGAVPESEGWVAFGWEGKAAMEIAEIRALMAEDDAPDVMDVEERCVGCGKMAKPVRLHDGLTALGNSVPVLLCWEREITRFGNRLNGRNLPTCPICMRLYVAYLNRHMNADKVLYLDGYSYRFSYSNRSAYIESVAAPGSELNGAWDYALHMNTNGAWMYKLPLRPPESIEDVPGDRSNMAYMHGYLYGILEWAAWVTRRRCPKIVEVAVAPGRSLLALLCELRDAADAYTPPPTKKAKRGDPPSAQRVTVVSWLRYAVHSATLDLKEWIDHPLAPGELADFGLGYAHSLGRRGPPRDPDADVSGRTTPWEVALSSALLEAGLAHERQHEVPTVVRVAGQPVQKRAYLDIAFPEAKLAVEVDGRLHGLDIRDHTTDSARAASLLAQGWVVYRVPNRRVTKACADVVAEIAAILRARASTSVTLPAPPPLAAPVTDGSHFSSPDGQA